MENNLLETILDRLARDNQAEANFGSDEIENWPSEEWNALRKTGIFRKATPARVLECYGCEENCPMPVYIISGEEKRPARAFISCDKRDDIGRVPVNLHRLEQWEITGHLLAKKIASLLGFAKEPQEENHGKCWALGMLRGKERKGQIALVIDNGVFLKIAGHDLLLTEILTWREGKLMIHKDELLRLVDRAAAIFGTSGYSPSLARRESRKLDTQKIHAAWQKAFLNIWKLLASFKTCENNVSCGS